MTRVAWNLQLKGRKNMLTFLQYRTGQATGIRRSLPINSFNPLGIVKFNGKSHMAFAGYEISLSNSKRNSNSSGLNRSKTSITPFYLLPILNGHKNMRATPSSFAEGENIDEHVKDEIFHEQGSENNDNEGAKNGLLQGMAEAFNISAKTAYGITGGIVLVALFFPVFMQPVTAANPLKFKLLSYLILLCGFYMAWNIGANDVANAMGTSVGSGALTLRQAVVTAAILEFSGALLVGSHVTHTMQNGILTSGAFNGRDALLFSGLFSSLASAGTWLQCPEPRKAVVKTTLTIVFLGVTSLSLTCFPSHWGTIFSFPILILHPGAIDVAKAIGPISSALAILPGQVLRNDSTVSVAILLWGGFGIAAGLLIWGCHVIATIGKKITELTPTRGFAAEIAAATVVTVASRFGFPISATHTLVGDVMPLTTLAKDFGWATHMPNHPPLDLTTRMHTKIDVASYYGLPVSTTHCIIGAMVGFGLVYGGASAVSWWSLARVVSSWIISPILGSAGAFIIYMCIRRFVYSAPNPGQAAVKAAPTIVFLGITSLSLTCFPSHWGAIFSFSAALAAGALGALVVYFTIQRQLGELFGDYCEIPADSNFSNEKLSPFNLLAKVGGPSGTQLKIVYAVFGYMQILSACFMSFAHGANDVANAIGPISSALAILPGQVLRNNSTVSVPILLWGGFGIVAGLLIWGYRVIATIGKKITELTPTRGFAAEFAAATVVTVASKFGLPISATHTLVGAVMGVGFARGLKNVDSEIVKEIVASWVVTIPLGALLSVTYTFVLSRVLPALW